jgi:hypothetical protein
MAGLETLFIKKCLNNNIMIRIYAFLSAAAIVIGITFHLRFFHPSRPTPTQFRTQAVLVAYRVDKHSRLWLQVIEDGSLHVHNTGFFVKPTLGLGDTVMVEYHPNAYGGDLRVPIEKYLQPSRPQTAAVVAFKEFLFLL